MADETESDSEKVHKLVFRYRNIKKTLNFYGTPKIDEESEHWETLINATKKALKKAFGDVSQYVVGVSQYVHGPVVPLSVVATQPKRYRNCYLDLIIDDEAPFLVDIQTERSPNDEKKNFKKDRLLQILQNASLGNWYDLLTKNKVDYDAFLLLDKEDLKELQIPIGARKKLLNEIEKEKQNHQQNQSKQKKTKWEDSQRQLSLPKYVPIKCVEAIPYHRLMDVRYRDDFSEFLKLHLRYFGWAFIKLPSDMVQQLKSYKEMWTNFFHQPQEYKDACTVHATPSGAYGGYYDEADRQMYQVVPLMLGCSPPWPEGDPSFQEKAVELFFFLEKIAKACLYSIARSLGIDPELFMSVTEDSYEPRMLGSSVRVCMYKKESKNTGVICVPHTDTTLLTLGAASSVPELQFYDRSKGEWVFAESEVDENHLILFAGRMLARMTGGYIQPTYHRVFRRYAEERLSLPFFLRPRKDAIFENEKIIKMSNINNWQLPGGIAPREILISEGGSYDFKEIQ